VPLPKSLELSVSGSKLWFTDVGDVRFDKDLFDCAWLLPEQMTIATTIAMK